MAPVVPLFFYCEPTALFGNAVENGGANMAGNRVGNTVGNEA